MKYILYKASPAWGLPSYSAASVQVEAYLRLAEIEVAAVDCCNPGSSPTGFLPALESSSGDILGKAAGEFEAAKYLIDCLKAETLDLDAKLSHLQQAQAVAFAALIRDAMEPASLYSSWCEPKSFSQHMRPVAGADLAVPLNYLTTWQQRRAHLSRFSGTSSEEIYEHAAECYRAVASQLKGTSGGFLMGDKPSSADALLYGHLALHLSSPVSTPELRRAVDSEPVLRAYAERVAKVFESPLPQAPEVSSSPEWAERAEAAAKGRPLPKKQLSEKEKEHRRRNWLWLGAATGIFAAYVVFSGQVIDFEYGYEDEEDEEDD